MDSTITIREAVPEDALGIGDVFYKTWLATYPNEEFGITTGDIEDRFKDRNKADGSKIRNKPDNELLLVAENGKEIIGVCRAVKRESNNDLQAIYILPEYQGRGIGSALLQETQKFFDPSKDTVVNLAVYNKNAKAFYERLGFKDTGKRFSNEEFKMKSGAVLPEMQMILSR